MAWQRRLWAMILPLLVVLTIANAQSKRTASLKFMGREVTITEPEVEDDFFPKGPATVCIEGPPQRQCYTAPDTFGRSPTVTLIQVEKDLPALLFSADSGGVSGSTIHFALLRPGDRKDLENLFPFRLGISNQSQHDFWTAPSISGSPIFVTADYVWGPGESHYEDHRYIISTYVWKHSSLTEDFRYYLEDTYMTVRKYDVDADANVLSSEKTEILSRLKRVKDERERQPGN